MAPGIWSAPGDESALALASGVAHWTALAGRQSVAPLCPVCRLELRE